MKMAGILKLRYLRTYISTLKPGVEPIYGPGSRGQFYRKPVDTLQYFDEQSCLWLDVPVVDVSKALMEIPE